MSKGQHRAAKLPKIRSPRKKTESHVAERAGQAPNARAIPNATIEHCQYIFDNLLEGCQIIGFDWRYRYVNESAARQAQCPKAALLGYTMLERYPGIEKTALFTLLQRAMQERTAATIENEFTYADQTSAWFELRIEPIPTGLLILSLDITERKRAEATERANADWMRLALEASNLGKWQHTLATGVVHVDERARRHYGFVSDSVTLDMVLNQIHPEDRARLAGAIATSLQPDSADGYATEYRVIHSDGSVHWLAVQAQVYFEGQGQARQPMVAFGTSQDITARKAAEDAQKRYSQRLEILHEIDLGIIHGRAIPEIMATALRQIRAFFGCQQAGALLLDDTTQELLMFAGETADPSAIQQGNRYPLPPAFLEEFGTAQITVIDDLEALPADYPAYQRVRREGMRTSLRALLLVQEHPVGVLVLNATTPGYFSAEQQAIAAEIANQLAIAIRQLQLSEQLARHVQTVEEMQQFLQATLDGFPAHTAVLDPQGKIITINRPWRTFADAQQAQAPHYFVGTNYLTICDSAVGPAAAEAATAAAGIRAVIAGTQADFYLGYACHSPDQERWFMLRVTPFAEPAPRRVVVAHIDITERRVTEIAEHEQRLLAEALRDSLAALTASLDVETVLQQILAYSATVIPSEAGAIVLFEGNQGRVVYARGYSPEAEAFFKTNLLTLDAHVYAREAGTPTYYLATDTETTPYWISFPVTAWVRSSVGVPIVVGGQPIGLLTADSATPNWFQPKHVAHLQTFARYAALALENAQHVSQLEQRVQARTAELQSAKEQVEAILNNSADGILLVQTDLRIQQTNTAFHALVGGTPATWVGQSLTTFIHDEDANAVREFIATAIAEQPAKPLELRAKRLDDSVFDAELSAGLIKGDGLVCTIRDITERKVQERQLRYHASLQENVSDAVIVTDMDRRILSWNRAAERIYGWNAEQAIGQVGPLLLETQFSPPESRAHNLTQLDEQGWWQGEVTQYAKEGNIRYILASLTLLKDATGTALGIVAVNHDITERKQAEQALQQAAAAIHDLYNNAPCGYHSLDADGVFVQINDTELNWLGYTRQEVLGKLKFSDLLTAESKLRLQQNFPQFKRRGWVSDLQFDMIRRDGSILPILLNSTAIYDEYDHYVKSRSIVFDITELKRAEAVLAARMEEEREFQGYLKALHEMTIELTQIEELDTFYRRVVELGLTRLGFDRMGLFLYDEAAGMALGTYGTDRQRIVFSQSHVRFTPEPNGIMMRAFRSSERFCFAENVPLYSHRQPVGIGWNGATVLWNGSQRLGWLVADNLTEQRAASKPLLDTLGLYGLTVGTLLAQKQAQIALRDSEARYRLLAENINDVVIHTNAALAFLYVSPSSYTVLGYTPAELLGQSVATYVHPDDLAASIQEITTAIAQKQPDLNLVLRFRHKQGQYLWLESNGRIVHSTQTGEIEEFVATSRDISDRKRVETALQSSEEKYRRLIDTMRGGLIMYDIDDRVSYINDRACELLGYQRHEIMGKRAYEYVDASAMEIVKEQLAQRRRLESSSYEVLAKRQDGLPLYLLVSGSPLVDNQGAYNGCFVIAVDISVQKQAEAALRQALAKEKELGELKSRFVSMASHEFRTPLATILALTETLSAYRHKLPDEQIEQRLSKIKDQISHLKGIMEDVLLLSRMQARRVDFHPVELDLDALCRDLLGEFQSPGDDTPRLQYSSRGPIHPVQVDQKLMRQIISNLLSNAVKYSPAEKPIQLTLQFTAEAFTVQVRDEGIGIPAADLNHLFEPFHRAANVGAISGTGLGLVITKEAVELHGGTITVDSQVQQGTTCTIRIPFSTKTQSTAVRDAS